MKLLALCLIAFTTSAYATWGKVCLISGHGCHGVSVKIGQDAYLYAGRQSGTYWVGVSNLSVRPYPVAVVWDGGFHFQGATE